MERELKPSLTEGKATIIVGPRRSGKTYLLYSMITDEKERHVYLNFENPLLFGTSAKDFPKIVDAYFDLYPENIGENIVFLLDEVQNVTNWEVGVRYLLEEGFKVALTGSSSRLFSKEIATQFRGRGIIYTLFPLSFREFLRFKGIEIKPRDFYGRKVHKIKALLEEYLKFGGFPEVVLMEDKVRILEEYISVMITKDVVERHGIKNVALVEMIIKLLLSSYAKYASYSSIYRFVKSEVSASKVTVLEYMKALEDSLFFFFLPKFAYSEKESQRAPKKVYLIDTGFSLFTKKDVARDMENVVFMELLRRKHYYDPLMNLYYYNGGGEVDFVVTKAGKVRELIQVTLNLEESYEREISALVKAGKALKCGNLKVVTLDEEDEIKVGSFVVDVIPLWKFLLV
ncbi:ATPase [Thermococcus chitonophagus]|uniref:ATPase n=1 Tax=Thermococcus chitonophagus TaxID=54262 RepID=A0A2Z2NBD5_9EURY|nr:ATPase [Thermococcus chitonophagus]